MNQPLLILLSCLCLAALAAADQKDFIHHSGKQAEVDGLLIVSIEPHSLAACYGLRSGDILVGYNSQPITSAEALQAEIDQVVEQRKKNTFIAYNRFGAKRTELIESGGLGVKVIPIKQQAPLPVIPDPSIYRLNVESIPAGEHTYWFRFLIEDQHVGFIRHRLTRENSLLRLRSEVVFDGGLEWGTNVFYVDISCHVRDGQPRLQTIHFRTPLTGFSCKQRYDKLHGRTSGLKWVCAYQDTEEEGELEWDFTRDALLPTYFVPFLTMMMPRSLGACFHYVELMDGEPRVTDRVAMICVGAEKVTIANKEQSLWRFEQRYFGRIGNQHWLDDDGRIIMSSFNGATAVRSDQATALNGIDPELQKMLLP